ncbi:hypothetical protein POF51_21370 [Brevibacillus sp. AG]|uniref:hypothetical protein n=1 Tax=Brevibacillus sp. AG TaxID=3020891 RepID=UPI00232C383E|nr:hypothetical protein [Brevibacillus sp. AG]MDC0763275.1 hypothetical protein [Brevibacillus sp. AG]
MPTAKLSTATGKSIATDAAKLSTTTGKSVATDAAKLSTTTGKSVATDAAKLPTTGKSVATDAAKLSTTAGKSIATDAAKLSTITGESVAADEAAFKGEPTTAAQATFKSEPATEAEAIDEGKSRARAQANATGASVPAIPTAVHATMPAISALPTVREPVDWPFLSKSTTDCESRTNATNQSISNCPTTDQTDAAVSLSMPTTISTHAIKAATSEKACVPGTSGVIIM